VDEFGRTLEEQLVDDIIWQHWIDRDFHKIREEYVSDDYLQDGGDDLPFGTYVTYDGGGPSFEIEEPYRAPWHKDMAIELLEEEGYDALVDWVAEEPEEYVTPDY
jgi:hypothetical protein